MSEPTSPLPGPFDRQPRGASAQVSPPRVPALVFDEDPGLLHHVDERTASVARRRITAQAATLPGGLWDPQREFADAEDMLGLLLLDGFVVRRVTLDGSRSAELLGPGDVIRPWSDPTRGRFEVSAGATWWSTPQTRIALLDQAFGRAVAGLQGVIAEVGARLAARTDSLAVRLAIAQLPNLGARLLMVFGQIADRWGQRAGEEDMLVPLAISHGTLADLVCAQRPSVTKALGRLAEEQLLVRREDGLWLLRGR